MTICLVSVFKNESHILKEWINHYLNQGVNHFFLTDNGSTDNYMVILENYINKGIVTLNINPTKYNQNENLNFFINEIKKYDWLIVLDLDEFMYARKNFKKISDFLNILDEDVTQVIVPWKQFGSNGFKKQPESVVKNFLKRNNYPNVIKINGKCITRTKNLLYINIHFSDIINKNFKIITSDFKIIYNDEDKNFVNISEEILENSFLHLNHYAIQSLEWFQNVKMTRGDASSSTSDNIRNLLYFKNYDWNIIDDDELKNYL